MNKKTVAIVGVIIVIVIVASMFVVQKKSSVPVEQEQNQTQQQLKQQSVHNGNQQVVDTSNWKTYRDEKYKFEIKYPKSWEFRKIKRSPAIGGEYIEIIFEKGRTDIGMGINRFETNESIDEWIKEKGLSGDYEKIFINNNTTRYLKTDNPRVYLMHQYYISYKNKLISFSFQEKYRKTDNTTGKITEVSFSQYLPDFEAMVNSIRFFD